MGPEQFDAFLQPLSADRREAVKVWLGSSLQDCVECGRPVRVMDGHESRPGGLAHRTCAGSETLAERAADLPLAVVARNARSDWG